MTSASTRSNDSIIVRSLQCAGYIRNAKIMTTLQGSVWRASQKRTNKRVVIKVTDRHLHQQGIALIDNRRHIAHENIKKEKSILKALTNDPRCPDSIIKYVAAFKTKQYYFLVMQDGGTSLFNFVRKAHRWIERGNLDIDEWHRICKVIFKQMMESIEYIHRNNVCHFDISLENFLVNKDVTIDVYPNQKMRFDTDSIQIRLCDFGVAEQFMEPRAHHTFQSNKYCGKKIYSSPEIVSEKKNFCARSNDVWCLGVCLFMIIVGSAPWTKASKKDIRFVYIFTKGNMMGVLSSWKKADCVNRRIVKLLSSIFKLEENRANIEILKQCQWLVE
eukprot:213506_1